ncbi:MAG TPA: HD domain-containing protein [Ktedonobacteraceae bacterium]|nr:HD domain-containing protein [Ktedonobacteraceae bacterium]
MEMISQEAQETRVLTETYEEVQQRFAAIDDLAHGWEHVQRVYNLALLLADQEKADRFIVGMAALMHDLGRTVPQSANGKETRHHADLSIEFARELLDARQVPAEKQRAILHAINAHSFSRNIAPLTLEAGIVRDADRLDALGATGILRWAITGTMRRNAQTRTLHPEDPFAEWHTLDDKRYMLDHFYTKLLKLDDTMTTASGRALAQQRSAFMRAYLEQLRKELGPNIPHPETPS